MLHFYLFVFVLAADKSGDLFISRNKCSTLDFFSGSRAVCQYLQS